MEKNLEGPGPFSCEEMQIVEAIHERIAQSEVRLRSAIRLIALFAALAGIAYFFKVI